MKNNKVAKIVAVVLAALLAFFAVDAVQQIFVDPSVAHASGAFDQIKIGEKTVPTTKVSDAGGLFSDMNMILKVFLGIAGFVVIMCIVYAGIKLATAQNNPQNRTQGFIGLGMALLGGWVVYKCLDLAGWIQGFGS
jgi:lipoprotein signal peptidase